MGPNTNPGKGLATVNAKRNQRRLPRAEQAGADTSGGFRMPNRRGKGLLAGAVVCICHAIAYWPSNLPPSLPGGLEIISGWVPFWVYATLWFTTSAILAWHAFRRDDNLGVTALTTMLSLWGYAYLVGWGVDLLLRETSRQYLLAGVYLGLATLIYFWSRPDQVLVVHGDDE